MRSRVVGLSIPSVPALCLKDQQIGDDTIYPELLMTVRLVCKNKLPVCWQLKDKENSPLTVNNYILKHNCVTIIYTIYTRCIRYVCRLFSYGHLKLS